MRALVTSVCVLILLGASSPAGQRNAPAPNLPSLPPISMTCAHHPDVLELRPGTCPLCKMALVPVRLDSSWMCPVHTTIIETERGSCRLCRRQLVPVTVALTWTCRGDAASHLEPGLCADGSPRIGQRTLRPHGNHNPRYGGQFFMAPDNWHHLEGVYPAARTFRLYLYDDYARPLSASAMREVEARVVTKETFDPATRKTTEVVSFPLRVSRNRAYLEARVDTRTLPAEMTAKVRFGRGQDEYRFDFTFDALTKAPAAPVSVPQPGQAAPVSPPTSTSAPAAAPAQTSDAGLLPQVIPESMTEILEQLKARDGQVRDLIARGDFGAVWVPAFQARDLAIALEPHLAHLAARKREVGEPAISRVVRGAWLLDASGDVGNRQQVEAAYAAFQSAVAEVVASFQ
ncbi:MAG TPA: heavy metal-binding domain-containing protein [Vicinamibacterales bacterium]|nr:heavy metal-binding domain-containing protein [Vicinamibacterales bacterium]